MFGRSVRLNKVAIAHSAGATNDVATVDTQRDLHDVRNLLASKRDHRADKPGT